MVKFFRAFLAISALFTLLLLSFASSAFACTGIQLKAQDGSFINGRTLEFGTKINTNVLVVPRNYAFTGTLPDGNPGLSYHSKYAVLGADMDNSRTIVDGLNETGLAAGTFYFPGYAQYAQLNDNNKTHGLSPTEFINWILTQFGTIDEVKQGLQNVVIVPTVFKPWGAAPPFHYVVYDKNGKSIVIEPINGKLIVHDNPLGVITNSPTFDWQMTNLQNYINLSPLNAPKVDVKGIVLKQFGQGSGLHGLPGDFTPPSRFVRAAVFSSTAIPSDNARNTVLQVFHILNQFDIPVGAVRAMINGKIQPDYTMITAVKNPQNLGYYFKTYNNQNIRVVYLKSFDLNAKDLKTINTDDPQEIKDISNMAR
ncbi:MAG: choloylglycine hydrolase family protein [Gammaproteobacteria bacterium]